MFLDWIGSTDANNKLPANITTLRRIEQLSFCNEFLHAGLLIKQQPYSILHYARYGQHAFLAMTVISAVGLVCIVMLSRRWNGGLVVREA